ncbi:protein kinase domain-containing protein [Streptomyces sp. WG7]|uniref:protein kinase domain-containing protein n=1 Tax=Streptomyces sp. WG7 TaxID=3417650 RepID=UPI003CEB5E32
MGEVFAGRYELVDPVGRGGAGAVWRAWDHRRRRYVAAKVLQQRDAHSLLRFVREQAMRIDHPHVLAPASWAADDDKVLFTMDLVTGGSLVHLVGDYGPLPPAFVCTLLDQLLAGLAAVHAEDVVHRDVKPANLLLEATGTGRPRLRLSDFGIAMRLGEPRLTETNLVVGTPGYLAPEQMMGAEPDFPADLFAVGLVALYLLEGAKPDTKALVQHFAEHGTPPAPRGVPEALWQVVATLVQPDPSARFRTATGARKALAAAAELLPEPGPDDELIEIFDQVGPLPSGFGPDGPLERASGVNDAASDPRQSSGPGAAADGTPSTPWRPPPVPDGTPPVPDGTPPHPYRTPAIPYRTPAIPGGTPPFPGAGTPSLPGDTPSFPGDAPSSPDGTWSPDRTPSTPGGTPPAHDRTPSTPGGSPPPGPDRTSPSASGRTLPVPDGTPSASSTGPARPAAMSETGSFRLPPPQAAVAYQPAPGPQPYGQPTAFPESGPQHQTSYPTPPPFPEQALPPPLARQDADVPTASYTAQTPQGPPSAQGRRQHRATRRRRRPGPPAKVAVPLLILALACYAVGFWALTRI